MNWQTCIYRQNSTHFFCTSTSCQYKSFARFPIGIFEGHCTSILLFQNSHWLSVVLSWSVLRLCMRNWFQYCSYVPRANQNFHLKYWIIHRYITKCIFIIIFFVNVSIRCISGILAPPYIKWMMKLYMWVPLRWSPH